MYSHTPGTKRSRPCTLQLDIPCERPDDLDPAVKVSAASICSDFIADCVYGSWAAGECRCVCIGEGSDGGYCRDVEGRCTTTDCPAAG